MPARVAGYWWSWDASPGGPLLAPAAQRPGGDPEQISGFGFSQERLIVLAGHESDRGLVWPVCHSPYRDGLDFTPRATATGC